MSKHGRNYRSNLFIRKKYIEWSEKEEASMKLIKKNNDITLTIKNIPATHKLKERKQEKPPEKISQEIS